jgi:heptosyltransferase II
MSVTFHKPPQRILVRGTNWLGDAVMTTPALRRLREKFPNAYITLLTPEKLADLWLNHPAIDGVISFTRDEGPLSVARRLRVEAFKPFLESYWERTEAGRTAYQETAIRGETLAQAAVNVVKQVSQKTIDAAQRGRIDLALVLPNSPRSALEVFLARIPQRIGYARPWRNFFLTQTVPSRAGAVKMHKRTQPEIRQLISQPGAAFGISNRKFEIADGAAHQIHEYLNLVAALGANPEPLAPELVVTPEEIEAVKKKFGLEKITAPIFGLNPGAEYGPAKRWPVDKFLAAAMIVQIQKDCRWLILGGKNDAGISQQIEIGFGEKLRAINLAGKTSLRELMALLKLCRVVLTNDTGPMHVAAALGTPVVVPFGSTSPELTGPGLPGDPRHRLLKSDAPCSPCFLRECPIDFRCMNGISVERVVAAVLEAGG